MTKTHLDYMQHALTLAARGRLTVSPNPMVGCVIVNNGNIVGEGYHHQAGGAHAEVHALQQAGDKARLATAYVTLEPCAHYGRTPPCTDALIEAGIKTLFIAIQDPNPLVAGKGVLQLRNAGIHVETGLCADEARQLNKIFFYYMTHQLPYVVAKWAMSLDGKTQVAAADSRQITAAESQYHTHALRQQYDAILIGANTANMDDPQLTVRHTNIENPRHPVRIILAGHSPLSSNLKLLSGDLPGKTIIATTEAFLKAHQVHEKDHVEVMVLRANDDQSVNLHHLLKALALREMTSLLIEGGMNVHHQFIQASLVNELSVYLAPTVIAKLDKKIRFQNPVITMLGNDCHVSLNLKEVANV